MKSKLLISISLCFFTQIACMQQQLLYTKKESKAIFSALKNNDLLAMAQLLESNNSLANAKNKAGTPIIHKTVLHSSREYLRLLLQHDADINAQDFNGNTPTHLAASQPTPEKLSFLLGMGADFLILNNKTKTALDYALKLDNCANIEALLQAYKEELKRRQKAIHFDIAPCNNFVVNNTKVASNMFILSEPKYLFSNSQIRSFDLKTRQF
jgi:ankyrin repeat protein